MRKLVPFGIAGVKEIVECRTTVSTYATVITLTLNLLSLGSKGKAEKELSNQRGEAKGLRLPINMLLAKQMAGTSEETKDISVPSNAHNERELWRSLRRELVKQGFGSHLVHANKNIIKAYVQELVDRGLLGQTNCVHLTVNSFETVNRVDSEPAVSNGNYRQPTVEDSESLSRAVSSTRRSTKDSHQARSNQPFSALPERKVEPELADVDGHGGHGKTPPLSEFQARGSDLVAIPAPLPVYKQPSDRNVLQRRDQADTIQNAKELSPQRRVPLQAIDSKMTIPVSQIRVPPEFADFQPSKTQTFGIWDEYATENPPPRCECYECMAAPTPTSDTFSSDNWQQENSETLQYASRPKRRAPSTVYHDSQDGSSKGSYSPPARTKKEKAPLLSLLLFPRMRKSTNTTPAFVEPPKKVPQPRKRQKRAPRPAPPPRPVSPTPPPPEWWLEERLRRRAPGFERGRSPTPREAEDPVYSRGIEVYPDPSNNRWNTYSYDS